MAPSFKVEGTVAPGFEPVKKQFIKLFQQGREDCSQVCIYKGQEKIVDLWGSSDGDKAYGPDSLQVIFSSTKSVTAIAVACMVDRGLLKYNEKVSKYWPEFAQKGKDDVKVADVLRHEAGLSYIHHTWKEEAFYPENIKKNTIGKVIEEAEQKFPPKSIGTNREYHGMTRGMILNEIFRRVEPQGRTIGEFLRDQVSGPLKADVIIGANKEDSERIKKLTAPSMGTVACHSLIPKAVSHKIEISMWGMIKAMADMAKMMKGREGEPKRVPLVESWSEKFEPTKTGDQMDEEGMKRGEFPSFNGVASARGLARLGACMANGGTLDGVKIMSEETVNQFLAEPTAKLDGAMPNNFVTHMTQGGVAIIKNDERDNPQVKKFKSERLGFAGWMGYGGSVFMWHPELKLSVAYVPSRLAWYDFMNKRSGEIMDVLVKCVKDLKEDK